MAQTEPDMSSDLDRPYTAKEIARILIASAVVFAGPVVIYIAWAAFILPYAFTQADPYPTFMANYLPTGPQTYQDAKHAFSDFVVKHFPPGSRAKDAIAQITQGGFEVTTSSSDSVTLRWNRHAGPCGELYSIVVNQAADGTIAKITGRLHPICL
jgi:hypothetical protein